jgi:hypothetical protein
MGAVFLETPEIRIVMQGMGSCSWSGASLVVWRAYKLGGLNCISGYSDAASQVTQLHNCSSNSHIRPSPDIFLTNITEPWTCERYQNPFSTYRKFKQVVLGHIHTTNTSIHCNIVRWLYLITTIVNIQLWQHSFYLSPLCFCHDCEGEQSHTLTTVTHYMYVVHIRILSLTSTI